MIEIFTIEYIQTTFGGNNPRPINTFRFMTGDFISPVQLGTALQTKIRNEINNQFSITYDNITNKFTIGLGSSAHRLCISTTHDSKLFDILGIPKMCRIKTDELAIIILEPSEKIISSVSPLWSTPESSMLVLSDIVDHSCIAKTQLPILARIPSRNGVTAWQAQPQFYVKVIRRDITGIRLWFVTEKGEPVPKSTDDENVVCQFTLRPRGSI